MNIDFVNVRNTKTGGVGRIARHLFENPAINPKGLLVEVEEGAKPFVPELYKDKSKSKVSEKEVSTDG